MYCTNYIYVQQILKIGENMRDKRKKFVELAENRVNNAIKQIKLIGNLANKSNYDYDTEDFQKIFRAVDDEVKNMKAKFQGSKQKQQGFSLKD